MRKQIIRVWVNETTCLAHEVCRAVPEVFAESGSYFPMVPEEACKHFESKRDAIIGAVMGCPTASLFIEFEDGRIVNSENYNQTIGEQEWLEY